MRPRSMKRRQLWTVAVQWHLAVLPGSWMGFAHEVCLGFVGKATLRGGLTLH